MSDRNATVYSFWVTVSCAEGTHSRFEKRQLSSRSSTGGSMGEGWHDDADEETKEADAGGGGGTA